MVRQTLIIVITSIILTQIATFSTSIYLHRTLAHRALSLHPIVEFLFRAALWLVTGQDRQQWVAVHRKHHTFTDREGDPHSPLLLGFWKVQLGNVYYYVQEARNPQTVERVTRRSPVGNLYVNREITGAMVGRQPFGGNRLSGTGTKAGGPDYLLQFVEPHVVTENTMRHGLVV